MMQNKRIRDNRNRRNILLLLMVRNNIGLNISQLHTLKLFLRKRILKLKRVSLEFIDIFHILIDKLMRTIFFIIFYFIEDFHFFHSHFMRFQK